MSSKIPRGTHLPAESKKTGHKPEPKDAATLAPTANGVPKSQKENVPRKNVAPAGNKGASTRYGQQAELREQNQNLMIANEKLQKTLTVTQQRVSELELQFSDLEKEKTEVEKHLKDCHTLLVTAKIDPVLGESVGEAARQNEVHRKEVMNVSMDLLNELRTFTDIASQQCARLEEIQTTMSNLAKTQEQMMQERESFALDAAEMEKALNEAEALLM